jgi:hypothetical protein
MSESPAYRLRKKVVPKSNILIKKATKKNLVEKIVDQEDQNNLHFDFYPEIIEQNAIIEENTDNIFGDIDYIDPESDEEPTIQALTKKFDSMNLMKDHHFYLTKSQKNKWKLYSE